MQIASLLASALNADLAIDLRQYAGLREERRNNARRLAACKLRMRNLARA